ncbi:MAG: 50S ribosomal protein L11 methyltransferase [Alphaproteobacteria bacterium]|nr:50S ribosomal protein L11 methyltransferase [Alphaproteobacteria bacterium SS10]
MIAQAGESWVATIHLETDHPTAEAFAVSLTDFTDAQMEFEVREDVWAAKGYAAEKPDQAGIEAMASVIAAGLNLPSPSVSVERLPPTDWVAHVYEGFKPIQLGRFFIHGSHHDAPPLNSWSLKIDAATAFGTGDHGSTSGCLLAFDQLVKMRSFPNVLDVGTGTGVLAMAAIRAGSTRAVAVDIDPQAVAVATQNVRDNGLQAKVRTGQADGTNSNLVRAGLPYDLVFANILAGPLEALSYDLTATMAPGAPLILAGLLNRQAPRIIAAYRRQGLVLIGRIQRGIWTTLVFQR